MVRPLRTCCLSFLSRRFSLSVLPDFFDATLRGDLSAMSTPFPVLESYSRAGAPQAHATSHERLPSGHGPDHTTTSTRVRPGRVCAHMGRRALRFSAVVLIFVSAGRL